MKKLILPILAFLGLGWLAIEVYGDGETKQARDDAVDGAKDAADKAGDHVNPETAVGAADKAADTIAGLSPAAWQIITVVIAVLCLGWMWKDPKRRALALGVALVALAVFVITTAA